ncbi:type III PLP-dependent enzyme [Candidatus Hepatincolaceae symbiont of Richtersius coronifer]
MSNSPHLPKKIANYLRDNPNLPTPFLVFDTSILQKKYKEFKDNFSKFHVFYAVKCNPANEVIKTLKDLESSFDVASMEEVDLCLSLGVSPDKISWGSPIKKAKLIQRAYEKKINIFVFDSEEEIRKIAENAPGSSVYCRILVNNKNALWPLSKKFGCSSEMAENLLKMAKDLGLKPWGVSFHVGSQQVYLEAWGNAIKEAGKIFENLKNKHGIHLEMLNLGGGYPAYGYLTPHQPLSAYKKVIDQALQDTFGKHIPIIFTEPGRFLVADAGVLKTEVILVSEKNYNKEARWVYLDIGMFGGLAEVMGESIKYKIITDKDDQPVSEVFLAGPTCDGMDILYKDYKYKLPINLKNEDYLYILSTGGYTTSYSTVCFNGFKPLAAYYI